MQRLPLVLFGILYISSTSYGVMAWKTPHLRWRDHTRLPRLFALQLPLSQPLPQTLMIAGDDERRHKVKHLFLPYQPRRSYLEGRLKPLGDLYGQGVLALFKPLKKYTYAITATRMYFASSHGKEASKFLHKHFFVGNYLDALYFAGECWRNAKGELVIDNNSGTYRPSSQALTHVADTLTKSLGLGVKTQIYVASPLPR